MKPQPHFDSNGKEQIQIPVIAAGGISGRGMLAAMSLGAEAVQVGSRFAASIESSAHENFKKTIVDARGTQLTLKELAQCDWLKQILPRPSTFI
jgi:enoyl-[acyl-carrier protein] reductase II